MLETTTAERERAWSNGPKSFLARVIRDVDAAAALLQDGVISLDPNEETKWAKAVRELLREGE